MSSAGSGDASQTAAMRGGGVGVGEQVRRRRNRSRWSPLATVSCGRPQISRNFWLKVVTLPLRSVTRMPSAVDSSVACITDRASASSPVRALERLVGAQQVFLDAVAREQDRAGVAQRDRAQQLVFGVVGHPSGPERWRRQRGARDARPDLSRRRCRGVVERVVAEGREAAVVGRAELVERNVLGRLEHAVAHLLGVSTRGSIGATTPTKTRWSGFMCSRMIFSTRSGSASPHSAM